MDANRTVTEPSLLVSRTALLSNAALVRRTVGPRVRICAVVKANAYGHDANLVVQTLSNAGAGFGNSPAVDEFAVSTFDEANALGPCHLPVLVLRPVEAFLVSRQREVLEAAVQRGWTVTVCDATAAAEVARVAVTCAKPARVHVMVDTGMARCGAAPEQLPDLLARITSLAPLRLVSVSTHLACSEVPRHGFTAEQLRRFRSVTDECLSRSPRRFLRHVANSGAVFSTPLSHLDMVRPGISLYGIDPSQGPSPDRPLRPAVKWVAPLIAVHRLESGQTVGYGQSWTARQPTRVGVVPVGYADGYFREFSGRAVMLLAGKPCPVIGRVSMDMTCIDATDVPEAGVGDAVTVLDDDPHSPASAYALAALARSIPYEVLSRVGSRVRRIAVDDTSHQWTGSLGAVAC